MTNIAVLLDKVLVSRSIASDNALSGVLGINRQSVSKWRNGEAYPDEERIAQLAEMADEDAGDWLLIVRAERSTGDAKKAYRSLAKRLGIAALLGLVAMPVMASPGAVVGHVVGLDIGILFEPIMHYAKSRYRLARRAAWRWKAGILAPRSLCEVPSLRIAA